MPLLTRFQLACEQALEELLEHRGLALSNRAIVSNGETFFHATITERDVEVWIYDDEAELHCGRNRRNFEAAVFADESERVAAFIKELDSMF